MTLSQRLTRGGLIILVFGTCASLLPSNGGGALAADTCPNANPTVGVGRHNNDAAAIVGGTAAAGGTAAFVLSNPGGHILPHRKPKPKIPPNTTPPGTTPPANTSPPTTTTTALHHFIYNAPGMVQ